ncbi:ABC transporter ATP-binding protein [Microbacterium azadirachtae]|uniref:ABC transporter ATP-binding protein n=1 Tax=Microbacterium azadirachtae TaxID=582680 RepID=UPI0021D50336|nr:ABC transporter ATP-binding protein [Microbacterium azadirachtae]UXW85163.1 ABC transporter ATP-binding protein [Microbacterium azadirachtae]
MDELSEGGIQVADLARSFGSVHAVRGASFAAAPGRVTGLVGPNGAGKTTLLLMLASLLAPDRGRIRIDGIDPVADPSAARGVLGWMPDALGAWPALTVRETIVTTARLHDFDRDEAAARTEELLELVDLRDLAATPARVLSRGQKQKLGLARALVHRPRVLLLDEPASGLDPEARVQLRVLLRDLAAEGLTILISSHVLGELEEVIDDAVFLVQGEVVTAPEPVARAWRIRLLPDTAPPEAAAQSVPDGGFVPETGSAPLRVAAALGVDPHTLGTDRGDVLAVFPDEAGAAAALSRLVGAGLPVTSFAPAQSGLEQAFLTLASAR